MTGLFPPPTPPLPLNVKPCLSCCGCLFSLFITFDFTFQYVVSLDQGKFASLTIKGVSMEDSGRYAMIVQNKYGGESVDIVVSSYHRALQTYRMLLGLYISFPQ